MASLAKKKNLIPIIFLFFLALFLFEIIAWDWWRHGPSSEWDLLVLRHTGKFISLHPYLSAFIKLSGVLGQSFLLWALFVLGAIFLAVKRDWRAFFLLLIIGLVGHWLLGPVKAWFQRPRPVPGLPGATGFSFPSGSAYLAAVVYGSLAFFLSRHTSKWWVKFVLFAGALLAMMLVGLSRVWLRLHWCSDVLGAYALAASWLLLNLLIYQKIQQKGGR